MKIAILLALLPSCAFTKVRHPSIPDRDAGIWVCRTDPRDVNGLVCSDAAATMEALEAEGAIRILKR